MTRLPRRLLLVPLLLLLLPLLLPPVTAADAGNSGLINIKIYQDETLLGTLYATGGSVTVDPFVPVDVVIRMTVYDVASGAEGLAESRSYITIAGQVVKTLMGDGSAVFYPASPPELPDPFAIVDYSYEWDAPSLGSYAVTIEAEVDDAGWVNVDTWTLTLNSPGPDGWLAITPGASGAWVTGGYDFHGTAYATRTGFHPLHAVTAFTVLVWVKLITDTSANQYLWSQYVSGSNEARLFLYDAGPNTLIFRVGNGTDNINSVSAGITWNRVYCIITSWESEGKTQMWVNGTLYESADVLDGSVSANIDFNVGRLSTGGFILRDYMHYAAVYAEAFSGSDAADAFSAGPDASFGNPAYYWTLNEGEGTIFRAGDASWEAVADWELSLYGLIPTWIAVQTVLYELFTHSLLPSFAQDSWFYVLILAALGAIACFGIMASMVADGDYDIKTLGILFLLGLFALLMVAGVILTV